MARFPFALLLLALACAVATCALAHGGEYTPSNQRTSVPSKICGKGFEKFKIKNNKLVPGQKFPQAVLEKLMKEVGERIQEQVGAGTGRSPSANATVDISFTDGSRLLDGCMKVSNRSARGGLLSKNSVNPLVS